MEDLVRSGLLMRYVLALLFGLGLSIIVGFWIGTGALRMIVVLPALLAVTAVVVGLQRRAWLLIPFAWVLAGKILFIPVTQFSVRDMAVLLAVVAWVAYYAFTHIKVTVRWHLLDGLVLANFLWLGVTYYLHPVGFRSTGSAMIGGRFYWDAAVALLAYWALLWIPENSRQIRRIPLLLAAGAAFPAALGLIAYLRPELTLLLYNLYSDVETSFFLAPGEAIYRSSSLAVLGLSIVPYVCARYAPISLLNPLRPRFYVLAFALTCVLLSGFRSGLLWVVPAFLVGSWLRRGWLEGVRVGVLGGMLLAILIAGQGSLYQLPLSAQRTLSFLPGNWNVTAVEDARGSSDARFQWWRDIVQYRLIDNWWLGDGVGFAKRDMDLVFSGSTSIGHLEKGSYHNGPLTAIRTAGIVGLVLFYSLILTAAWWSVKCARSCAGSPLFPLAVFIAIPLLWHPVHYTLIYGQYSMDLVEVIFRIGLLRLALHARENWVANVTSTEALLPDDPAVGL